MWQCGNLGTVCTPKSNSVTSQYVKNKYSISVLPHWWNMKDDGLGPGIPSIYPFPRKTPSSHFPVIHTWHAWGPSCRGRWFRESKHSLLHRPVSRVAALVGVFARLTRRKVALWFVLLWRASHTCCSGRGCSSRGCSGRGCSACELLPTPAANM